MRAVITTEGHYAYLKIAEGCNKHCTYCIIPKIRGEYRSIPMEFILKQAEEMVQEGVKANNTCCAGDIVWYRYLRS